MPLDAKSLLLVALGIIAIFYLITVGSAIKRKQREEAATGGIMPTPIGIATGFVTDFLDTLGVGSFATTTAIFRFFKSVPDEQIPGTLNVGHTLATIVQAIIFTQAVDVDATTLISMIAAATLGAWLGAGVVSSWPRRRVQFGMGLCLLVAAGLTLAQALGVVPGGGEALGVSGIKLGAALVGNFMLGALMTLGIGLYGPCLILVSLLGMNPKAAFPIMMGSCAFLMPVASAKFAATGRFNLKASIGLIIGGIPAVFIAVYIVKSLPLLYVRWLVVAVVLYTAVTLLRSSRATQPAPLAES